MCFHIQIDTSLIGNDWVFLIRGGRAHIGAVVIAYTHGDEIHCKSLSVPGHREEQLATEMARYAAHELKQTITVIMGIHVDHATKQDIQEIIESVHHAMTQEMIRIKMVEEAP